MSIMRWVALAMCLCTPALGQAQMINLDQLNRASGETPPVQAVPLTLISGKTVEQAVTIGDTQLFAVTVDQPGTILSISLEALGPIGVTVELNRLSLNAQGQATERRLITSDASIGQGDRIAVAPDTMPEPGEYFIGLAGVAPVDAVLRVKTSLAQEVLPTGDNSTATLVEAEVAGLTDQKPRCLRYDDAGLMDLVLMSEPGTNVTLEYKRNGRVTERRTGNARTDFTSVDLSGDAEMCVEVRGGKPRPDRVWRLRAETSRWTEVPERDGTSMPLSHGQTLTGVLDQTDADYFDLPDAGLSHVRMEAQQQLRFCAEHPDRGEECQNGRDISYGPLLPGTKVWVDRGPEEAILYRLAAKAADDNPRVIAEPNARPELLTPLSGQAVLSGTFATAQDRDTFRLDAGETGQVWRFLGSGEALAEINISEASGGELLRQRRQPDDGKRLAARDVYIPAGLVSGSVSGQPGDYKLLIKPLGPPVDGDEREPNDPLPNRMQVGEVKRGTLPHWDRDRYAVFLHRAANMRLTVSPPAGAVQRVSLNNGFGPALPGWDRVQVDDNGLSEVVHLPAGEHVLTLQPHKGSPAEYTVSLDYELPDPSVGPLHLQADELPEFAAYSEVGQRAELIVHLKNPTDQPVSGILRGWASDPKLSVDPVPVSVGVGETVDLIVVLSAAPDLYETDLILSLTVDVEDTVQGALQLTLQPRSDAPPIQPTPFQPVPEALRGGINVAWSALGARWIDTPEAQVDPETGDYARNGVGNATGLPEAIDGYPVQSVQPVNREAFLSSNGSTDVLNPILDLAGEGPVSVAGIGIDTRSAWASSAIARFAVDLSVDGTAWREVLEAEHDDWGQTAYYVLPDGPVDARFLRLRPLNRRGSERDAISVSELEVIATPGASGLEPANIASAALGARLMGGPGQPDALVTMLNPPTPETKPLNLGPSMEVGEHLTLLFRSGRPARIARVELVYADNPASGTHAATLHLGSATDRPSGTSQDVLSVQLPAEPGSGQIVVADWPDNTPVHALHLRFEGERGAFLPVALRVIEAAEDEAYRSVLGAQGAWQAGISANTDSLLPETNADRGALESGEPQSGVVQNAKREERWMVGPTANGETLRVLTYGSAGFEPSLKATDETGATIDPQSVELDPDTGLSVYTFPGSEPLTLTVSEDQRSVFFLFDQSPSVAPLIPRIRRNSIDFAESMVAGRDRVAFGALGRELSDWFTDPAQFRRRLIEYGYDGTSSAEASLAEASLAFGTSPGSRAILIVTDADADRAPDLPGALAAARAPVYVLKISSGGMWQDPKLSQPAALSWAALSGGEVWPVLRPGDISVGYARAAARLLGPKSYSIQVEAGEAPADGALLVSANASLGGEQRSGRAYHILFDTSGSMLKRLDGGRRIDLAKAALSRFIGTLPAETPLGLRVFGGTPDRCETDLLRDLAPVGDIDATVQTITPQNLAKTPIAMALSAAARDLEAAEGRVSVLLITDGEETCDGDPLAEVQALAAMGIQTELNVVSLSLAEDVDRAPFRAWAEAGGGTYVDVADEADLAEVLTQVVLRRFDVLKGGEVVASGVAETELTLPAGPYVLRMDGADTPITIRPDEVTRVE
ncbi:MAG: VWA domain-containing protein [Paracoccaceae bacterium]